MPLSSAALTQFAPKHTELLSSARRHLQQNSQTYQATVTFTLSLTSQPATNQASVSQDLSTAIKQVTAPLNTAITATPISAGNGLVLNVSITFPPGNTVSATPSQGTLAAVNLVRALIQDPVQALPSLYATTGSFTVQTLSISDALVAADSPSSTIHASPIPAFGLPTSLQNSSQSPSAAAVPVQAPLFLPQASPLTSPVQSTQGSNNGPAFAPTTPTLTSLAAAPVSVFDEVASSLAALSSDCSW